MWWHRSYGSMKLNNWSSPFCLKVIHFNWKFDENSLTFQEGRRAGLYNNISWLRSQTGPVNAGLFPHSVCLYQLELECFNNADRSYREITKLDGGLFFIVHKISTAILGHILDKALKKAFLSLHKSNSLIICISLIMCQESWQSVVRMWLQVQPL